MADLVQPALPSRFANNERRSTFTKKRTAAGFGFGFLIAFFVVYCSRPEDWIAPLYYIPLAKITAGGALLGLLVAGRTERKLKDFPREGYYLLTLILLLFLGAVLSPVWRGGAFLHTMEFAKIIVIYSLIFLLVTSMQRLRRLIFVEAAAMVVVTGVSIIKGYHTPRLEGVIGGIYSNANDLAFAIVLTMPFCLGFLITSKRTIGKIGWALGLMVMLVALFMTASRAGFIDFVISGTVCLYHFGVRGKRRYLIVVTGILATLLLVTMGQRLVQRFEAISEQTEGDAAFGSYQARKMLMLKAVEGIAHYPVLGVGANNFMAYTRIWHQVHMTYLQIGVEGGLPALMLYLTIFYCGFRNLRKLRRIKSLPQDFEIFAGAIHSSLVGFAVGALFSPEAYHFFPFFSVAYTSAMLAMVGEQKLDAGEAIPDWRQRRMARMNGDHGKEQPQLTIPR